MAHEPRRTAIALAGVAGPRPVVRPRDGIERRGEPAVEAGGAVCWKLRANCALTPRQLSACHAVLCGVGLGLVILAWIVNLPWVAAFVVLNLLAMTAAMLVYARHAVDGEFIRLDCDTLHIEQREGCHVRHTELCACWASVRIRHAGRDVHVTVAGQGQTVRVGGHLQAVHRLRFAAELRAALARPADPACRG